MPYSLKIKNLSILLALLACCMPAAAAEQQPVYPAEQFSGETLHYVIDFWLFRGTAEGELCFEKTALGYRAYFEAETKGLLRALAGSRREVMESIMDYDPVRQRLRPLLFREMFVQNKKVYQRTVAFDYEQGFYTCTRKAPGRKPRSTRSPLPETQFEDMLTLYYNLRLGCYGTLPGSEKLRVPVIMKEKPSYITIEFNAPQPQERSAEFPARLAMERDLTHAFSKSVLTWFTPAGLLKKALVVDAYFFGDLQVRLAGITYH